jgi:hypothetical protein
MAQKEELLREVNKRRRKAGLLRVEAPPWKGKKPEGEEPRQPLPTDSALFPQVPARHKKRDFDQDFRLVQTNLYNYSGARRYA